MSLGNLQTRRGRQLIEWIALNDEAGSRDDRETVAAYVTVVMLSHVYGVPTLNIADAVLAIRNAEAVKEGK